MRARRVLLLVLLAAFATVVALILLDPTADLPAGVEHEPTPVTPVTAGPPVPYLEEP